MISALATQQSNTQPDPRFAGARGLFFCIGAMKCGTTWLNEYFRDHPDVHVPSIKETHYWDTVRPPYRTDFRKKVDARMRSQWLKNAATRLVGSHKQKFILKDLPLWHAALAAGNDGHKAYADLLFIRAGAAQIVGEVTPYYAILDQSTLSEMAGLAPDSKFILIMRDPVDRLIANIRHRLRNRLGEKNVVHQNVTDALVAALDRDDEAAVAKSRYDLTIAKLDAIVPANRVSYHFYETFFQQGELDCIADFLGIGRQPGRFDKQIHAGVGRDIQPDAALLQRARRLLAPCYDMVSARFGDRVPDRWRRGE
jgi:hypothetical protein